MAAMRTSRHLYTAKESTVKGWKVTIYIPPVCTVLQHRLKFLILVPGVPGPTHGVLWSPGAPNHPELVVCSTIPKVLTDLAAVLGTTLTSSVQGTAVKNTTKAAIKDIVK